MIKHFISLLDYSKEEILHLLDSADGLKSAYKSKELKPYLKGKRAALIWDAEGFRNRVAFEAGISALGGVFVQIPGKLDAREPIEDVTKYLANWFDCIVARTNPHEHMKRLTTQNKIPVINARTDYNHPCEILGDLQYIRMKRGRLDGLKIAFVGEATNLCISWFEAAARLPMHVVQACPHDYEIDGGLLDRLKEKAVGQLEVSSDLEDTLRSADVIYTDCWPKGADDEARENIRKAFLPYQITSSIIKKLCPEALFLPCPPVTRGQEVSADAMEEYGSHVYEAKEHLLYAQNAVLVYVLKAEG